MKCKLETREKCDSDTLYHIPVIFVGYKWKTVLHPSDLN